MSKRVRIRQGTPKHVKMPDWLSLTKKFPDCFSPTKWDKFCWSRTAEAESHWSCHLWRAACGNTVLNGRTCNTINTNTVRGLPQHGANPASPNSRSLSIYKYICKYIMSYNTTLHYVSLYNESHCMYTLLYVCIQKKNMCVVCASVWCRVWTWVCVVCVWCVVVWVCVCVCVCVCGVWLCVVCV